MPQPSDSSHEPSSASLAPSACAAWNTITAELAKPTSTVTKPADTAERETSRNNRIGHYQKDARRGAQWEDGTKGNERLADLCLPDNNYLCASSAAFTFGRSATLAQYAVSTGHLARSIDPFAPAEHGEQIAIGDAELLALQIRRLFQPARQGNRNACQDSRAPPLSIRLAPPVEQRRKPVDFAADEIQRLLQMYPRQLITVGRRQIARRRQISNVLQNRRAFCQHFRRYPAATPARNLWGSRQIVVAAGGGPGFQIDFTSSTAIPASCSAISGDREQVPGNNKVSCLCSPVTVSSEIQHNSE